MKEIYLRIGIVLTIVVLFFLLAGCTLIFGEVGTPSIFAHDITYYGDTFHVQLHWDSLDNADEYVLERKSPDDGLGFFELTWEGVTSFVDDGYGLPDGKLNPGHLYIYRVRGDTSMPVPQGDWSSEYPVLIPDYRAPDGLESQIVGPGNDVLLTWDSIGAEQASYRVERSDQPEDWTFSAIAYLSETSYIDEDRSFNTIYYYRIKSSLPGFGESTAGSPITVYIGAVPVPQNVTAAYNVDDHVIVSWDYFEGAEFFVMRDDDMVALNTGDGTPSSNSTDALWYEGARCYYRDEDVIGEQHSYRVYSQIRTDDNWQGEESALSDIASTGGATPTGTWQVLGTGGFATADDSNPALNLVLHSGEIYALFADGNDGSTPLTTLKHNGTDIGSWTGAGGYISDGSVFSGSADMRSDGSTIYVSYAESDKKLYVKEYSGSVWSSTGDPLGVSYFDDPSTFSVFGSVPSLGIYSGQPLFVSASDNGQLVQAFSYPGSGNEWTNITDDSWKITGDAITAFETAYVTDGSGGTAFFSNSSDVLLYDYNGSTWSASASPYDHSVFTLAYLIGAEINNTGEPIILMETVNSEPSTSAVVLYYNGLTWVDTGLSAYLTNVDQVFDSALFYDGAAPALYAAVAFSTTTSEELVQLWSHSGTTGGSWTQVGPSIDIGDMVSGIDLCVDGGGRPVLVYADSAGSLTAQGYRE